MSMQRIAIMSAVGSHLTNKNRTFYVDQSSGAYNNGGIGFQRNFNMIIAGTTFSFLLVVICVMCYCFNRSINKNSMALYRQQFIRSMNEHNVDIYTVEQFYEAETYVPLCTDSQSQIHGLPPSYDTVMASEKRFLEKYGDLFRSKKCCHHMQKATSTVNEQCGDLSVVEVKIDSRDENECSSVSQTNINECFQLNETLKCEHCNVRSENFDSIAGENADSSSSSSPTETTALAAIASTSAGSDDANASTSTKPTCTCVDIPRDHSRTPSEEIDVLNDNGILRMDMSKIIDQTGLPTYDAAIKLESYGYV